MLKQQLDHCSVHSGYTQRELYLMRSSPQSNPQIPHERQSPQAKSGPESWPKAPRENAPTSQPPRPSGKLEWVPRMEGSMGRYDTSCWYSVCQTNHPEPMFTAWTRNPLTSGMRVLECGLPTFKAAIAVCQKDADERYARGER